MEFGHKNAFRVPRKWYTCRETDPLLQKSTHNMSMGALYCWSDCWSIPLPSGRILLMQMRTTHRMSCKLTRKWTIAPLLLSGFLGTLKPQKEQTQRHLGGLTFPATHHCFSQVFLIISEATCDCALHCAPSKINADHPLAPTSKSSRERISQVSLWIRS